MADVTGDGDRGQLLLVAALGMAVLFVALALTLNTAIYTENLATRGSDLAGGKEALGYRAAVQDGTAGLIEETNYGHNESYSTLESNLSAGIRDWNSMAGRHGGASAAVANVSPTSSTRGTRIVQDVDRNFTDDDANATWTLAEDVSGTREYRMNVSSQNLIPTNLGGLLASDAFTIQFVGSETWNVSIYEDGTEINVTVEQGGTVEGTCSVTAQRAVVDITGETIDGESCPELGYLDNVSASYDIRYRDAVDGGGDDTINGTYELIIDKEITTVDPTPDPYVAEGAPTGPYLTRAIYSADVRFGYNTTRLEYAGDFTVTPGETLD